MAKGMNGEARDFGGSNREMKDKGMAPVWRGDERVADGENINISDDTLGFPIEIQAVRSNLVQKGDANYTGKFQPKVGRENWLKSQPEFEKENPEGGVD